MNWLFYTASFCAAFGMSWLISQSLPAFLKKRGIYDKKSLPDKKLTAGGLALIIPFLAVLIFLVILHPPLLNLPQKMLIGLFISSALIALLGLYDDIRSAPPAAKLVVQAVAGIILVYAGVEMNLLTNPFAESVNVGSWGNVILVAWLVIITNAVNLIDGVDGLASGICLISSITMFSVAQIFGEAPLALLSATLAGAIFGFIRFNLPPAKLFLGDTGALFLGFTLAAISVMERRKGMVTMTLLVPLLVMTVPLVDSALAFFRRAVNGRNPLLGDKRHIHHRLIKLGFSSTQVNYMLYFFSIYLGITAGILSFFPKETAFVVLALLAIGIFLGLWLLRTIEVENKTSKAVEKDTLA